MFLHSMVFAIPAAGIVTAAWAAACRLAWRRGKSLEEP